MTRTRSKNTGRNAPLNQEGQGNVADNVPNDLIIQDENAQEVEHAAADLRVQLNRTAPDARIGLEDRRNADRASGQQTSHPAAPQINPAALSAIVASILQDPNVVSALVAKTGENNTPVTGEVATVPPPPPRPQGVTFFGNDEGILAADTHSHTASPTRDTPAQPRGKISAFNRLGDIASRRVPTGRVADRLGGREPGSPKESFGSVSRTTDRPRPDKGKGKLNEDDARHQINLAHAARIQTPLGGAAANTDPRDEIIARLEKRLADMEAREAAGRAAAHTSQHPNYDALLHKVSALERELADRRDEPVIQIRTRTPFSARVLSAPIPEKYKGNPIKPYDGRTDPQEHFTRYQNNMMMTNASEEYMCRWFLSTLEGPAYDWFNNLPEGSIDSWQDLAQRFLTHFAGRKRAKKHFAHLLTIKQQSEETLRAFLDRWTREADECEGADERTLLAFLRGALRPSHFARSLFTEPPRSYLAALRRGDRHADADELLNQKKGGEKQQKKDSSSHPHHPPANKGQHQPKRAHQEQGGQRREDRSWRPKLEAQRIPLTHPVSVVLDHAEAQGLIVKDPRSEEEIFAVHKGGTYCKYHRQTSHKTEDCTTLKRHIDGLVRQGELSQFVKGAPKSNTWVNPGKRGEGSSGKKREIGALSEDEDEEEPRQKKHHIHIIVGGNTGGDSATQRKKWAQSLYVGEVSHAPPQPKRRHLEAITFTDKDLPFGPLPHRDALVVKCEIGNNIIHRNYIDTGSSVNVMYVDTFRQLKLKKTELRPIRTPLSGFTGDSIDAEGTIVLPVVVGDGTCQAKIDMEFVVVNLDSAHNMIWGRPALEDLEAIISMRHLCLKFPTKDGVGYARGNQKIARACYLKLTRKINEAEERIDTITTASAEEDTPKAEPVGDVEDVPLDVSRPERTLKIGTQLPQQIRRDILSVLRAYAIVFAWGPEDMPGISPKVITHRLSVNPASSPIKQKKRYLSADRREFVKAEVAMLLSIKHIKEVKYPTWLANVVLAPKPPTFRMCVDYTDLNKACPMDPFPLPNIDQLVDETAGCELMSFLDAFRGYHQISMHEDDAEKTAFMTPEGIFCYLVMAFGLKNSGATYTRMVARIFRAVLGRTMEAYVDDMIVKSRQSTTHADDLRGIFEIMKRYNLRLNPKKCTFGVQGGKFLGYLVSRRGIEVNPEKIQAIINMEPPRNIKEVQRLMGRLAALNRFLSKSAEKSLPFFQIMRKATSFKWTTECQQAFEELKQYLASPPVLSKPQTGETLFLYLGVSTSAVSSVLIREDDGVQKAIFYVSKTLREAELRYSPIEKTVLAIVHTVKKLGHYFQAHPVHVLTHQPLGALMRSPTSSPRMIKWAIFLSQYQIEIKPRPSIKGQALADFVTECTARETAVTTTGAEPDEAWTLYTDGSSATKACGGGVVLISPEGFRAYYAIRFNFKVSNNEAEYEALLSGLRLAAGLKARHVRIKCDSKLVVSQMEGSYEAKEGRMKQYKEAAAELLKAFDTYEITQIPRAENAEADILSKLSSDTPEHISKIANVTPCPYVLEFES
ncbi:unnamed protein product [Cuscuta epithymum]|uniref:RNase H type-1 domain-containing protein n=1 Tax=Cuscuta epithymum TaxID=186058 RepID=A0AAV0D1Q3_9ASTE|nr:unnamed protein product [Cuscuta epithymum]